MPEKNQNFVIAIDGPVAAGKSTIAKKISQKLKLLHINSGALYRNVSLYADEHELSLEDEEVLSNVAETLKFEFRLNTENWLTDLYVNGVLSSPKIYSERNSLLASKVSTYPKVRSVATDVQRQQIAFGSLVLEGRDAGSIVFPNAKYKFYLDASVDVRVQRRFIEQQARGVDVDIATVKADLEKRDYNDTHKGEFSLRIAEDAQFFDTSNCTIDEVLEKLVTLIV